MIEIKDIEFGYRSKNILHNISFDMNEGHCIAILGVNGAGKSTLIKCLNRINPVHKGAVMIENSNILQIHLTLERRIQSAANLFWLVRCKSIV